jgi:hypothetical protein
METKKFNRKDYKLWGHQGWICDGCVFDSDDGCLVENDLNFICGSQIFLEKDPRPEKLSPDSVGGD